MKRSVFRLYGAVTVVVAACYMYSAMAQPKQTSPAEKSGIDLEIVLAPTKPVERDGGSETVRPHTATVHISAAGVDFDVTTDEMGHARIELPPGEYKITPKGSKLRPPRAPNPQNASVKDKEFIKVRFIYDSGIR